MSPRLFVLLTLVAPVALAASGSNLVSVMPIAARGAVDEVDREVFEDLVRDEASRYLVPAVYVVLDNATQLKVYADNGFTAAQVAKACESSCPLEMAKELNVRMFVAGHVSRTSEGELVAQVRMFDGVSGSILASIRPLSARSQGEVRDLFAREAKSFFTGVLAALGTRPAAVVEDPRPSTAVGLGSLLVKTVPPGATVRVDGANGGEAPVVVEQLLPGEHALEVELETFELHRQNIKVASGETSRVEVRLVPLAGKVRLSSRIDAGASCTVGGRSVEVEAGDIAEIEIAQGSFDVRCEAPGYLPFETSARVRHRETTSVAVANEKRTMTPEEERAAARRSANLGGTVLRSIFGALVLGGGVYFWSQGGAETYSRAFANSPVITSIGAAFTLVGPGFAIGWGFSGMEPDIVMLLLQGLMGAIGPGYVGFLALESEGPVIGDVWPSALGANVLTSAGLYFLLAALNFSGDWGSGGDVALVPVAPVRPDASPSAAVTFTRAF